MFDSRNFVKNVGPEKAVRNESGSLYFGTGAGETVHAQSCQSLHFSRTLQISCADPSVRFHAVASRPKNPLRY